MRTAESPPPPRPPLVGEPRYAARFTREHEHVVEDLPLWRAAAARAGGPVLDVGCATGRVSIDLARAGHEVLALDACPAMLEELERRARAEPPEVAALITTALGRMEELDLGRTFPLVLVTMNTLQLALEAEDRRRAMARLAMHLAPGGELCLDVALLDPADVERSIGEEAPISMHRTADGAIQVQTARFERYDAPTGTLDFTIDVHEAAAGRVVRHFAWPHRVHVFRRGEMETLAREAGLEVRSLAGDFSGGPLRPDSEHQVFRLGRSRG